MSEEPNREIRMSEEPNREIRMSEEPNRFDAVRRELAETAQQLREVTGDAQLRLALLRRMRELLNEADEISRIPDRSEEPASNGPVQGEFALDAPAEVNTTPDVTPLEPKHPSKKTGVKNDNEA